jgi:hypothetical protein
LAARWVPTYTRFNPNALATILNFRGNIMTTITNKQTRPATEQATPFSLMFIIETLFAVNLREQLDANTGGDKSDAKYTYGM